MAQFKLRSVEEAHSECEREVQVRDRIYEKWIAEGKIGKVDARDRMERMQSACHYLAEMMNKVEGNGDLPVDSKHGVADS